MLVSDCLIIMLYFCVFATEQYLAVVPCNILLDGSTFGSVVLSMKSCGMDSSESY